MLTNHNNDSGLAGATGPSPPLPEQPAILQPNQGACCSRGPPAFLMKAYAMVDDPNTNHIISWSLSGTSLVVWDHIKLAVEILPKYFKHNSFSSFIYQLNNYLLNALNVLGFRKIGLKQWEYENQLFKRGNKQLLLNIKRRNQTLRVIKRRYSRKRSIDVAKNEIDTQLENLRNHIAANKEEMQKLKEQQALVQDNIDLIKKQIGVIKDNSLKIIKIIGKALGGITLKDVTQQIGEDTVCKEEDEVPENRLTSDTEQMVEVNVAIREANASRSCQENTFWRKFLELEGHDENQSENDFVRDPFMLNMELGDMMESNIDFIAENESKPPKIDVEDVNLRLWK